MLDLFFLSLLWQCLCSPAVLMRTTSVGVPVPNFVALILAALCIDQQGRRCGGFTCTFPSLYKTFVVECVSCPCSIGIFIVGNIDVTELIV